MEAFWRVFLVDTPLQLTRKQRLFGATTTIVDLARNLRAEGRELWDVNDTEFLQTRMEADVIFSVCVYDAVLPDVRMQLATAAARNLRARGEYFVLVPRNDQSILSRCGPTNRLADGHYFDRGSSRTFFRNFRRSDSLIELISSHGFELASDWSTYRHVWLRFRREG